jgi:JAB domain-containing protein similar to deubiquitination enzymes
MALMLAVALTIAYPFDARTLARADISSCFDELFAHAYYGHADYESAAFLILNNDKSIGCREWRPSFAFRTAQWTGSVPDGTIAIAHTHPQRLRRPSRQDLKTAADAGVPVIVVTQSWLAVGATDGSVSFYQRH